MPKREVEQRKARTSRKPRPTLPASMPFRNASNPSTEARRSRRIRFRTSRGRGCGRAVKAVLAMLGCASTSFRFPAFLLTWNPAKTRCRASRADRPFDPAAGFRREPACDGGQLPVIPARNPFSRSHTAWSGTLTRRTWRVRGTPSRPQARTQSAQAPANRRDLTTSIS